MKVAFFTDSLPPSTDGVANSFVNLAKTMQKEGHSYYFFSPFKPVEQIHLSGYVTRIPSIPLFLYPDYKISLPYSAEIKLKLDQFQPDIIHVSSPTLLGKMGLNYARKSGIPVVASYHTHFISYFKYYGYRSMENFGWKFLRWFYNRFEKTFVPSSCAARDLENRGFTNIRLWRRGVELDRFSPNRRNPALRGKLSKNNEPILLFVGRLVKEKDLDDLIAADRNLKLHGHKFSLVITGDGPMRAELQKKLPEAHFTGLLHGGDLAEMYASSDVFVFPSTTETFGNVILEASASGLPVVAVNEGGAVDLVKEDQTGFLAGANNPEDFAYQISRLLKNPGMRFRFSENGRKFAGGFDWDIINNRLINEYRNTIDQYQSAHKADLQRTNEMQSAFESGF